MANNEQVQKYYDALIASYDVLTDAIAKSAERGIKVTKQLATDVAQGQREALELGKRLASEPSDLSHYYTAVLEATTAAQGRALAFAQATYQEAIGATQDSQESFEKLVKANREAAEAAVDVFRNWATANPMADIVRQGIEAWTPQTSTGKKAKATAKEASKETAGAGA